MDSEIVKLFWEWYFPYNNQEIYKDDIAKMAFVAGYKAAQQSVQSDKCPHCQHGLIVLLDKSIIDCIACGSTGICH